MHNDYLRHTLWLFLCSLVLVFPAKSFAWSNHALGTWQALAEPLDEKKTPQIRAESLENFLSKEAQAIERLLDAEEQWARTYVPSYPARPESLRFQRPGSRAQFLAALRINPNAKLPLYLQIKPNASSAALALAEKLPWQEVTTLSHAPSVEKCAFIQIKEGEKVTPLDVIASASDEPDYGLDLGLWEDNGTSYGQRYGFGKEPFGNPALEYATQAPFHIGFFHESPIILAAAGFLKRTYPEYRIHMYQSLADHAFRSGHDYWGWRFAGWALHYIQDLTQPYHASVLPGLSVPRMLWINALDLAGAPTAKREVITLLSNRHAALENYQYYRMHSAYAMNNESDELLSAVRQTSYERNIAAYTTSAIRQVISKESHAAADATDALLEQVLPAKYISDPNYQFGEAEPNINLFALLKQSPLAHQQRMSEAVSGLMMNFGVHSRSFVNALFPITKAKK